MAPSPTKKPRAIRRLGGVWWWGAAQSSCWLLWCCLCLGLKVVKTKSSHQLQGMVQGTLFQGGTLAKPGRVETVFLASGPAFMVGELRHGIQQSPGRARGRGQIGSMSFAVVQGLYRLQGTLVHQALCRIDLVVRLADDTQEIIHRFMALDLALREGLHAVNEGIPTGDRDAQLLFDGLGIEAGAVGDLDGAAGTVQGNGQGVLADDSDGGGCGGGGQGAITAGGQQEVAFHRVIALERRFLAGFGQRPELLACFEDTGGFQLEAGDFDQIAVELQHFTGLDHLVAARDHRQGGFGVRTVQDLLIVEGHDGAEGTGLFGHVAYRGVADFPVHPGFLGPDVDGLFGRQLVAELMPGGLADVGHGLDCVCHDDVAFLG